MGLSVPLVSIVIPAYNAGMYIANAIASCRRQTYDNIEIVVIDDGSTDDTREVLGAMGDLLVLTNDRNRGGSFSRNRGIGAARGRFVKFLDADDILVEDSIERQVRRSLELDVRSLAYGTFARIFDGGKVTEFGNSVVKPGSIASMVVKHDIQTSTPLHRKSLLEEVGGFDERFNSSQEWNLHVRLTGKEIRFRFFDDRILWYREHDSEFRICTQRFRARDFGYEREKLQMTLQSVKDFCDRDASAAFAKKFWDLGREALREGQAEVADECFREAVGLAPTDYRRYWKPEYRIVQGILGTNHTERLFGWYLTSKVCNC